MRQSAYLVLMIAAIIRCSGESARDTELKKILIESTVLCEQVARELNEIGVDSQASLYLDTQLQRLKEHGRRLEKLRDKYPELNEPRFRRSLFQKWPMEMGDFARSVKQLNNAGMSFEKRFANNTDLRPAIAEIYALLKRLI